MTALANVQSRPRYEILDGLRGVAALLVICYHFFEGFATSPVDQSFNHGYLAVDFFFVLSGFVIAYAYDARMKPDAPRRLSAGQFLLRRVIRLQPMVIIGVILGLISFLAQGSVQWDGTNVSATAVTIAFILALFMLPTYPGGIAEVRGNGEMFPLNGPSWSLFFEYIGSIIYALLLCRLNRRWLTIYVTISAAALIAIALCNTSGTYHLGVGWTAGDCGWLWGFFRMSFSFSAGVLMQRLFTPRIKIRHPFLTCSLLIILILAMPYIGAGDDASPSILNAIYDLIATLILFPLIVYIGASSAHYANPDSKPNGRICEFLGAISYPVYIIHYPFMYYFYHIVWSRGLTHSQAFPYMIVVFISVIILSWLFLRYYDTPLRSRLTKRLSR